MPMKRSIRFVCLLLAALLLCGCSNENTTAPESSGAAFTEAALKQIQALGKSPDDNYRTWYEIFVYSFCDSNGDGIGDLQGVISKLDYLQNLGITGIWLMPIHPSTSYHKYNVTDYYSIDPAYGTMANFEQLMTECNKRGIKVILDLVVNHTGSEHAWFKTAVSYLQSLPAGEEPDVKDCKYLDYYYFTKEQRSTYRTVNGTDWYYEGVFDYTMPDLNWGSDAVREEVKAVMQFWLGKGVAGFRVDAAKEFYSGKTADNIEVMNWLQTTATAIDSDCYMVAEVWESFSVITDFYRSEFTSIFNYPFGNSNGKIISVLRGAGNVATVNSYATALEKADKAYRASNPDYIDAPFLSNHDVGRIAGFVGRDESKTKLAGAMNLFMSGSAFIYYGEEIGMVGAGDDPSKRAPMYWNAERNQGTTQPPPGCTLPDEYPFGSLEDQKPDDSSIYNYYRQAIAIRNALPVISHGSVTAEAALNSNCISAQRKTWNEESCIILMNVSQEQRQVDLSDYTEWELAATLSANGEPITMEGTTLTLAAWGIAVLIPNS